MAKVRVGEASGGVMCCDLAASCHLSVPAMWQNDLHCEQASNLTLERTCLAPSAHKSDRLTALFVF